MSTTRLPPLVLLLAAVACGGSEASNPQNSAGTSGRGIGGASGGSPSTKTGGTSGSAGSATTGGTSTAGTSGKAGSATAGGAGGPAFGGGGGSGASTGGTTSGGASGGVGGADGPLTLIKVSDNKRYLATADGKPFFWLSDTAWLLFVQLNRQDTEIYLENRRVSGYTVIQVMVLVNISTKNKHGDSPFSGNNIAAPLVTEGSDPTNDQQYDWWDHADYVIDLAAKKGIYVALVPMWGEPWVPSNSITNITAFSEFLAKRYKDRTNIFWMNGGDRPGDFALDKWNAIGATIDANDPNHLITYHPRGRQHSSTWFHNSAWLDFNMFQTGHAERNTWEFVEKDYVLTPIKPTMDGEPAYEEITVDLDGQVYWTHVDNRRHAYRSVFAGSAGHTYGHNAVWQFNYPGYAAKFHCRNTWQEGIEFAGGAQMQHLKNLMLSRPYFERIPDQTLVAKQGTGSGYLSATRGERYAFVYSVLGDPMEIAMGKIAGAQVKASWYDPRTGISQDAGMKDNAAGTTQVFDPPGEPKAGNDWVLVLDSI